MSTPAAAATWAARRVRRGRTGLASARAAPIPSSQARVWRPKYAKGLPDGASAARTATATRRSTALRRQRHPAEGHRPGPLGQTGAPDQQQEQQRPDDVELLLDTQGPVVQDRALVRVGHVLRRLGREAPVGAPEGRAHQVAGDALPVDRRDQEERGHRGRRQDQRRERQQPPDAPGVEVAQRDRPGAGDLVDEQAGDEEAGEDEEHVHADEPAADDAHTGVEGDDQQDRHGPQPLDVAPEAVASLAPRLGRRQVWLGHGRGGISPEVSRKTGPHSQSAGSPARCVRPVPGRLRAPEQRRSTAYRTVATPDVTCPSFWGEDGGGCWHTSGHRPRKDRRRGRTRSGRTHPERPAQPAAGHRPRRDAGVARQSRRGHRGGRPHPRSLPHAQADPACPREAARCAVADRHGLHQHHPAGARALVPRRRGGGAPLPRLAPLERRGHGAPRAAPRDLRGRPHLHLRLGRDPLRGRLQPLLARQGPPGRRRPGLLPGPRLPRHVRPRVPRGPAHRGAARRLPPGEEPPRRRQAPRAAVLPAPAPHAGLLGVPDGLHGHRPHERHLPGAVQQVPPEPRHQGHQPAARLGVPRRRRDGRAGVARPAAAGSRRGARQPDLRHQLQPAAARRPGARQRQDHPGAGVVLPRRRLERHQGRLGPRLGPAAGPGPGRRARQHHEPDERRRLPDVPRQRRRLRARALLRPRPAHPRDGQGLERRGRLVEAQARRPRLPQGVCRLQGRDGAHRPADGHPREDHQGLRPRQPLRRPQRHAPDEEAHPRRPQGPARQPQAADQRRAARGRPVPPAVLPPGRGRPDDPVREGAAPEARRLPAVRAASTTSRSSCRRTSPTRS